MTETVLAIDPGKVSGWSLWLFEQDRPLQRIEYGLVHGGLPGWTTWMEVRLWGLRPDVVVCEKFELDGRTVSPDLTPLLIEGGLFVAMSALGMQPPVFQTTDYKAQVSDVILKRLGLFIERAQARTDPAILHTDGDDVNDSQRHALAWAQSIEHIPTVAMMKPKRVD